MSTFAATLKRKLLGQAVRAAVHALRDRDLVAGVGQRVQEGQMIAGSIG
jgi:hypothetical protein